MIWSRIDSGFWRHPKFAGWTAAQKWHLGELFGYCAEYDTGGRIPDDFELLPRGIGQSFVDLCLKSGWIDQTDEGLFIHDWKVYHPDDFTAAERMRRHRARNATRNEQRDDTVTPSVTDTVTTVRNVLSSSLSLEGPEEREREFDQEQTRRAAWQARAQQPDVRSPEAFVTAGMNGGGWPDLYRGAGSQRPTENGSGAGVDYVRALIQNGVVNDALELNAELDAQHVPDDQRAELHAMLPSSSRLPFSAIDQDDIPF